MGTNDDGTVLFCRTGRPEARELSYSNQGNVNMMKVLISLALLFIFSAITLSAQPVLGPVTSVESRNGLPEFYVDGKPFVLPAFETYVPGEKYFRQFKEAGCRLYGFATNCAMEPWEHSTPTWVGHDVWDYSEFDACIGMILSADPDALIMPRIHVAEPDWWRAENPVELMVYSDGSVNLNNPQRLWPALKSRTFASVASLKWREDMAAALRNMISHIQSASYANHIFGYQILGMNTEEWYHITFNRDQVGDYSPHMRQNFREWLKRKYWTTDNLRKSWNNPWIDFEKVEIPSKAARFAGQDERTFRDPATEMPVIDFYQCYNDLIPEVIDYLARVVKDATNRTKVVGAFYAYMFEFAADPESGHLAVEKLLKSDNVDFVVVTASYGSRQLGSGGSILRSPHTSLKLHNKLWAEDNDNVSFLFPEVSRRMGDAEWERSKVVLACTENAEESKWIYQRGAGFTLGNGVHQSLFDLHGGYFDHPDLLNTVRDIYGMYKRSVDHDRGSCAEILVVADELATMYPTIHSRMLRQNMYDAPYRLIKCGAPYDAVYLNDLPLLDTTPYKLVIMLNTYCVDDYQKAQIEQRIKTGGKTVLWVYAPGLFNGNKKNPEEMSALTGINLAGSVDSPLVAPRIELKKQTGQFIDEITSSGKVTVGPDEKSCAPLFVQDADAAPLGVLKGANKTVMAVKKIKDYTSVYTMTASLPPSFYRALARSAGAHIYNDSNDTLYVSRSYLTVNADGSGTRTIKLPRAATVYDAITETVVARDAREIPLSLRDKETRILRMEYR